MTNAPDGDEYSQQRVLLEMVGVRCIMFDNDDIRGRRGKCQGDNHLNRSPRSIAHQVDALPRAEHGDLQARDGQYLNNGHQEITPAFNSQPPTRSRGGPQSFHRW